MRRVITEYWLGDEQSAHKYYEALRSGTLATEQPDTRSPLLDIQNGIGIVNINGPLVNAASWFYTSYQDIRDALVEAAQSPDVSSILLNINSPGGSANGVEDISTLIKQISAGHKPVTAYSNGQMASAAYWIGVAADKVYSSRLATVGSIGVIAMHFDQTKMLEDMGVKVTVFRAGEFKALGGPYEALSEKAQEVIQARMDTYYQEFVGHIAMSRGVSPTVVHEKMADGREFLGFEALKAGLVDGNLSLDELVSSMVSKQKQPMGASQGMGKLTMEGGDMPKILSEQDVAVLAGGGSIEAQASVETADSAEVQESQETPAPAETADAPEASAANYDLVTFLKAELSAAQAQVLQLTVDAKHLQAKLDSVEALRPQLRAIAEDVINVRSVALGRAKLDLSTVSDEVLVQQYNQVTADFGKTFTPGAKALAVDEQPKTATQVSDAHIRSIKAAKLR